jgi:hypothetical protein
MRTLRNLTAIALLSCALAAPACTGKPAQLWNQKFRPDRPVQLDRSERISLQGRACGFNLFGFVPMNTVDRTARAYRQMTADYEAFHVTDVEMQETMSWWVIGTSLCTKLSATAYRRR